MSRSWDVFCRVIDNFGDAAVCWRLAKQLASEHGGRVRLWIDELPALRALCAEVDASRDAQRVSGVDVHRWTADAAFGEPAEIAIDAFGCGLPEPYAEAMAARRPRTLWIILEYLSAEPWVATHHRMPSPHPRLPLERFFFFPGIGPGTGGVLHESGFEARREAFTESPHARTQFWRRFGFAAPEGGVRTVSLFGYENDAVGPLLQAWADGPERVVVAVTESRLKGQVAAFFDTETPESGQALGRRSLEARFLPFLSQHGYDELLWACDWNFVRGEDSFVRAQWARRPFVWHIYPQADDAHFRKLNAFLDVYCTGLDPGSEAALRSLWTAWNRPDPGREGRLRTAWEALGGDREGLHRHAAAWAGRLTLAGDLAGNLAQYCDERLK